MDPGGWLLFGGLVGGLLALDLGVFHRKSHEVSVKEAAAWTAAWVVVALGFGAFVWSSRGPDAGLQFLTGYVIEKALSVDNIFVFLMVFAAFGIPRAYQHRVLYWGVLGALAMRGVFVLAGAALIERFSWTLYAFGGLLALTGLKMLLMKEAAPDPASSPAVRWAKRLLPATDRLHGDAFFHREGGRVLLTPLAMALAAVEGADLVFAVDSVPAVFAVTRDPFIVYTSNIFAIMGLRSMFFALAGVIERLAGLKVGLALVLVFVGAKMLATDVLHVHPGVSLAVVTALLAGSALLGGWSTARDPAAA
ncbi:MAG: TerC family protein [Elusimicrobia bacterium]|nr:TerC family protein [Elusimicrobiota bacterium]